MTTLTDEQRKELRRYNLLRKDLDNSDGLRIHRLFLSNQTSVYVFEANFRELFSFIRLHYKLQSEDKLGDFLNREPLHNFLLELTRRLHNFTYAAASLVQHTRTFVCKAYGRNSPMFQEYLRQRESYFDSGIEEFTTILRDFFAHKTVPAVYSVCGGEDATLAEQHTVELKREAIFDYLTNECRNDALKRGARRYLEPHRKGLNLLIYVSEYYELTIRFYSWLDDRNHEWIGPVWKNALALQEQV